MIFTWVRICAEVFSYVCIYMYRRQCFWLPCAQLLLKYTVITLLNKQWHVLKQICHSEPAKHAHRKYQVIPKRVHKQAGSVKSISVNGSMKELKYYH
jgi:hypothetical protein